MIRGWTSFLLALLFVSTPCLAETRVALVIGNGAYQNVPRLLNPTNDAADVSAALKRDGFETILSTDLDKTKMEEAIIRFARAARAADVAMFYYSGHALQFGGVNYLAPVDAKLTDEADLHRLVRLDEVVTELQQAKNLRILVLDSCRDNPLADQLKRSIGTTRAIPLQRGLAKIDTPLGMIVAYSTQAGQTAEDGDGRNSPYTAAFLKHIEEQEEIGNIFRQVSEDVYEATTHKQLPELSLSIVGRFYFRGKIDITVNPAAPAQIDPCGAASDHWRSAEALGTIEAMQDHLKRFPNCAFAGLANTRIENLKSKLALVVPPAVAGDKLRRDLITDCDRLAGHPTDSQRAEGVAGVFSSNQIDIVPALRACTNALDKYPEIARFAFLLGRIAFAQKDYTTARRRFEQAADMGNPISVALLGVLYQYGLGTTKDDTKARQLFEKAANMGEPLAMYSLGAVYERGSGTGDQDIARKWYEKAVAVGEPNAMVNLGSLYDDGVYVPEDRAKARELFENAAALGNLQGLMKIGSMYLRRGDSFAAHQWFEKAAAAGEPNAQEKVGQDYNFGRGVGRDYVQARQWYEKAAASGNWMAMDFLGTFYEDGIGGVPKDNAQAREWYEKAAAAGSPLAKGRLQKLNKKK
jgi:TPR repeat protein/uncharacterized caspase-like protein